jgi:Xaa-Pro aminopeptidase
MQDLDLDLLVFGPSADMHYFSGLRLPLTERFNALAVAKRGPALFIAPKLQEPLLEKLAHGGFRTCVWAEGESPFRGLEDLVPKPRRIGVGARLWSTFLLEMQRTFPTAAFCQAEQATTELRIAKDAEEIAILEDAARRFDAIWEEFFTTERLIGRTEMDIRRCFGDLVVRHGFEGLAWCDVGSGPNGASPLHHGSEKRISAGEPVVIDFAASRDGYFMDTCRTPVAGEPDPEFVVIYDTVNRAYEAAAALIRPGVAAEAVDAAARKTICDAGHGDRFIHRLGHGLGLDEHEPPYIIAGNDAPLREGMVFSNEPGIYVPGRWGVRIENIMLVTPTGGRSLNDASRALVTMP